MNSQLLRTRRSALLVLLTFAILGAGVGCSAGNGEGVDVTVFAASSLSGHLQDAMEGSTSDDVTVSYQFAGSQALLEQIRQGATPDVVVLAEPSIDAVRFVPPSPPAPPNLQADRLVRNRLAVVTPAGNPAGITGLADLQRDELRVAICAPAVPCGASTKAIADRLQIEISADTMESSVRSVLAKVVAQEVDVAVVYATDAQFAAEDVTIIETISTASGYVAWKLTPADPAVDQWYDRLLTAGVSELERRGFPPLGPMSATVTDS